MDMNVGKFREMVKDREAWPAAAHGVTKRQTCRSNWTTNSSRVSWLERPESTVEIQEETRVPVIAYGAWVPSSTWNL